MPRRCHQAGMGSLGMPGAVIEPCPLLQAPPRLAFSPAVLHYPADIPLAAQPQVARKH